LGRDSKTSEAVCLSLGLPSRLLHPSECKSYATADSRFVGFVKHPWELIFLLSLDYRLELRYGAIIYAEPYANSEGFLRV